MRRIISILLFGLLLYNMVGYSLVYLSEGTHRIGSANSQLIQQNSGTSNIVIKVPVSVPYQTNWDAPQPAEGQIEHAGQVYQMRSRQLVNDTLYVQCEFDQSARDRFSDLVTRISDEVTGHSADPQQGQHSLILKHFLKEYMAQGRQHVFYLLEWAPATSFAFPSRNSVVPQRHSEIPSPPPDRA